MTTGVNPTTGIDRPNRNNRAWVVAHQTPGTTITGQTSFDATTPTFAITQNGSTMRAILRGFQLAQASPGAAADIFVRIAISPINRYSSGGTTIAPQLANMEHAQSSTDAPGFTFRYNPTCLVADPLTRYLEAAVVTPVVGDSVIYRVDDFGPLVRIGGTGSILIYTWASTTGPTWVPSFSIGEELIET